MSVLELQSSAMANEIRNTIFLSTLFPQNKDEEGTEKVGSARLREPRDLYSAASLQHPPKWPIECQVLYNYFEDTYSYEKRDRSFRLTRLEKGEPNCYSVLHKSSIHDSVFKFPAKTPDPDTKNSDSKNHDLQKPRYQVIPEKIKHIDVASAKLEPFYVTNNTEPQPRPVGEEMGTVIFDYHPKLSVDYFCRSCVGGSDELQSFENTDSNTLKFESRFESGNLARVIKVTNVYYELYLRPDMYTDRHSQWYYFRVQNTKENVLYRFSIVNLNKPDSLYRYGLKPLVYSEKDAKLNRVGWTRRGQNIAYYKNDISCEDSGASYTLTFNLKFKHNNDTVYIAQCYPYTYSKLQSYLQEIESDKLKSLLCQQRLLCKSLAGNNVYVLTITSPENDEDEIEDKKPVVVLSARVHPGETPSSYMMKGIIDFLISASSQAQELRDRFIFKLIPMLNPDGVIVGNSRCCLLGQDLNRQYATVLREAFPQIYHTKVLLRRLAEENGVFMYCDIHGHSRRNNAFIYGCENRRIPEKRLTEQIFPLMMHKNAADKFSFQYCKFKIQKSKEGTGRIFAWTLGIGNSYTLEISLCGSTMVSRHHTHFNIGDYEGLGRHFCETLLDYSDNDPAKERLREKILRKLLEGGSTAEEPLNIPITDYSSLSHSETDESDTTEDDEEEETQQVKASVKRQKCVRLKKAVKRATFRTERASLNLSTTSVEFIRGNRKQRKSVAFTTTNENMEIMQEKELTVTNRLRSFRRSRFLAIQERQDAYASLFSPKKYTRLLFDDPFNPPGKIGHNEAEDHAETGTPTEDECDNSDSAIRNELYLSNPFVSTHELTAGIQSLKLTSPSIKKRSTTNTCSTITNLTTIRYSKSKMEHKPLDEQRSTVSQTQRRDSNPSERRRSSVSTGIGAGNKKLSKTRGSKSEEDSDVKSKRVTHISTIPKTLQVPDSKDSRRRRVSWAGGTSSVNHLAVGTGSNSSSTAIDVIQSKAKQLPVRSKSGLSKHDTLKSSGTAAGTTQSNQPRKKDKRKRTQGTSKSNKHT